MTDVSGNPYDLGPDFSKGIYGPDRSLLAHCLGIADSGWAVEFGVGSGETTRMIADVMPVIGFDSFDGLPEDWRPGYPKGAFKFPVPDRIPNCTIVPGWFDDTVPNYDWPENLALVHFDADLYSSTKVCLESVMDYVQPEAILVFDEFFGYDDDYHGMGGDGLTGEAKAWVEWVNDGRYVAWDVIGHGREQWAIRITAI